MLSHAFGFCKRARLNAQETQFNGAQGALGGDVKFEKRESFASAFLPGKILNGS
jgi:hypothetical protein